MLISFPLHLSVFFSFFCLECVPIFQYVFLSSADCLFCFVAILTLYNEWIMSMSINIFHCIFVSLYHCFVFMLVLQSDCHLKSLNWRVSSFLCLFLCISLRLSLTLLMYLSLSLFVCPNVSLFVFLCLFLCISLCLSVPIFYVHISLCLSLPVLMYLSLSFFAFSYVSLFVFLWLSLCIYLWLSLPVLMYLFLYVFVYFSLCISLVFLAYFYGRTAHVAEQSLLPQVQVDRGQGVAGHTWVEEGVRHVEQRPLDGGDVVAVLADHLGKCKKCFYGFNGKISPLSHIWRTSDRVSWTPLRSRPSCGWCLMHTHIRIWPRNRNHNRKYFTTLASDILRMSSSCASVKRVSGLSPSYQNLSHFRRFRNWIPVHAGYISSCISGLQYCTVLYRIYVHCTVYSTLCTLNQYFF